MFHSARWKAYLRNLQKAGEGNAAEDEDDDHHKVIYHIFHSQMIWFVRDDANHHHKVAMEHLKQCDVLLGECNTIVDALEETLYKTPKPSEVLDWSSLMDNVSL